MGSERQSALKKAPRKWCKKEERILHVSDRRAKTRSVKPVAKSRPVSLSPLKVLHLVCQNRSAPSPGSGLDAGSACGSCSQPSRRFQHITFPCPPPALPRVLASLNGQHRLLWSKRCPLRLCATLAKVPGL